ncbi:ETS-related transcription factor Elf-1-like isoform X2 [Stylophora pistillata]|uniref:ETS-related transcription factor Elf-1-like isoform X2 n=1 Tax=Stylophora pistillata TaxID=50429 RepID=UPI000C053C60|nr:ETS-related transcription factor Elf-1-like isoform X2 [Stylophora pistillata]
MGRTEELKHSVTIFTAKKGFAKMSLDIASSVAFHPNRQANGELAVSMLKKWLSSYGHPSTTGGPIIASTITIEAIQDLLHSSGFPIEAVADLKFTDLDACSEYGYGGSDLSDDEINFFQDLPLSPDSPLLCDSADIDFGFDSGIEAEMDEPHDGAEDKDGKKEEGKTCEDKKSTDESKPNDSQNEQSSAIKPVNKDTKAKDKMKRVTEEKDVEDVKEEGDDKDDENEDDLPHIHCQYLWEFLHQILLEKQNKYIAWKNQTKGVFRLLDHNGLARLWGKQKNRKNMTYEKLSRALRYYYSKNILKKVPGQRLTYKFVRNLNGKKYPN